jgi:peptide methionine sulfoxide reductase MsrA
MQQGQSDKLETANLAGGCFWRLEVVFDRLRGAVRVESG